MCIGMGMGFKVLCIVHLKHEGVSISMAVHGIRYKFAVLPFQTLFMVIPIRVLIHPGIKSNNSLRSHACLNARNLTCNTTAVSHLSARIATYS